MLRLRLSLSNATILAIGILMVVVSSNINWGKEHWRGIIETDAKGYFAYLPAVFVYHDMNFGFFDEIETAQKQNKLYFDYRTEYKGVIVNKFFCGTALANVPFFLGAHAYAHMAGHETDGYSKPYPIGVNLAAVFYMLLGLLFLNRAMDTWNIREVPKTLTLLAALFGTNLFYYTIVEPGMSHVYSFAFVAMFVYYARRWFATERGIYLLALGLALGMVVLTRPVNGLIVFILPFAAGSWPALRDGVVRMFQRVPWLLAGAVGFVALLFVQLTTYKLATGEFLVYSYAHETFHFLDPNMFNFLLSYKKGLFVYTPMFLLAFAGVGYWWRNARFALWSWLGFFVLVVYVLSSWWLWWYGGSFSARVMVEYIPVMMIGLAMALNHTTHKVWKPALIGAVVTLTLLCQVQTYQYRYYQIHWEDMTSEKYWDVFLRLDKL